MLETSRKWGEGRTSLAVQQLRLPFQCLSCHAGRKNNVGDGAGGRDAAVMCRGVQQKRNFIFDTWVAVRWLILTIDNY